MIKSKRFVAFIISLILFIGMIIFTDFKPMEIAGAITMITTAYIGGETFRDSKIK